MKIQRYDLHHVAGQDGLEATMEPKPIGTYVKHCDYLKAVESLEYDIRYALEQLSETQDELKYYKELYFALCEQSY